VPPETLAGQFFRKAGGTGAERRSCGPSPGNFSARRGLLTFCRCRRDLLLTSNSLCPSGFFRNPGAILVRRGSPTPPKRPTEGLPRSRFPGRPGLDTPQDAAEVRLPAGAAKRLGFNMTLLCIDSIVKDPIADPGARRGPAVSGKAAALILFTRIP
jgi:hypothetical protein